MMTLRTFSAVLGAGVMVLGIAACGDDGGGDAAGYCDTIADLDAKSITELDTSNSADVSKIADVFSDIASKAPDDIEGDWHTVAGIFSDLAEGMDPLDVDPGKVAKLEQAMANIEKQVKSNCDVEL